MLYTNHIDSYQFNGYKGIYGKDLHNKSEYRVLHEDMKEGIRYLYASIFSHILDSCMKCKHEHDSFDYQLWYEELVKVRRIALRTHEEIDLRDGNKGNC